MDQPWRSARGLLGSPVSLPLLLVFAAGVAWVGQITFVGHLGHTLGSPELASGATAIVMLSVLVAAAIVIGAPARARWRLATMPARNLRLWHGVVGLNGALFLIVVAYGTPRLGAVAITVAVVSGQLAASLVVDRFGLGPAGLQPITRPRLLGTGLALLAVCIGAGGTTGQLHLGLLALAALAGVGTAFQQAALGHVGNATGEPVLAGVLNTAVATIGIWVVVLAATGGTPPNGWSAPPLEWFGGFFGATVIILLAVGARTLGVLRLMLAFVAGQTLGSVVVDLVNPPEGEGITLLTILGVVITIAAVFVSGIGRKPAAAPAESDV